MLKKESNEKDDSILTLQSELHSSRELIISYQSQIEDYNHIIEQSKDDIRKFENNINNLMLERNQLEGIISGLGTELAEIRSQRIELITVNDELSITKKRLEEENNITLLDYKKLKQEIYDTQNEKIQIKLKVESINEELQIERTRNESLQKSINELTKDIGKKMEENQSLSQLNIELNALNTPNTLNVNDQLRQELKSLRLRLQEIEIEKRM